MFDVLHYLSIIIKIKRIQELMFKCHSLQNISFELRILVGSSCILK